MSAYSALEPSEESQKTTVLSYEVCAREGRTRRELPLSSRASSSFAANVAVLICVLNVSCPRYKAIFWGRETSKSLPSILYDGFEPRSDLM